MVIASIYERARAEPERLALVCDGVRIGYGALAGFIEAARRYFVAQALAPGGVALIVAGNRLDAWGLGLGLRAAGFDTLVVPSREEAGKLGPFPVACVAASAAQAADAGEIARARGAPLIVMPPTAPVQPDPSVLPARLGGHILLTSGTTGTYKKVLVDAASEAANVGPRAIAYGVRPDSLFHVGPLGGWTGAGYNVPMCCWAHGGAAMIHRLEGGAAAIAEHRPNAFFVTPLGLEQLLTAPEGSWAASDDVEVVVTSGALSVALYETVRRRFGPRIVTCVGSTEVGPYTRSEIASHADLPWHRVLPFRRVEVVGEDRRPLPAVEMGYVRIAREDAVEGYFADPETTAAFFEGEWFYPGDLGVFGPDGRLSLQGRMTDVVSVQGVKVATGPIETAIQDALGAHGVCLLSFQGEGADEEHHLAIEGGRQPSADELRDLLQAHLTGAGAVQVHYLETLPRNETGKVMRAKLRELLPLGGGGPRSGGGGSGTGR